VRRVLVDPSVTSSIPAEVFQRCKKLAEVELCEGLVEIGERVFQWCDHSIIKINIPNTLRRIRDSSFARTLQTPVHLHDDVENIGFGAFSSCIFINFRVPPLITVIARAMLSNCKAMFSAELPESVIEIGGSALFMCPCLRNVVFPPHVRMDAAFGDQNTGNYWDLLQSTAVQNDLYQLFGSIPRMIQELKHRFDGLPIHRLIYYQSYNQGVLQNLIAATRSGQRRSLRSNLEPTGNQQDCLGMTPLHILACSSVHDLEVYRVIVEKYPGNLITEDAWGALPLLYAFWGAAPAEIIQFLLDSYQSLYPGHAFNWTMMVKTMGRTDTPKERIEYLLCVHQTYFPEQSIVWDFLLNKFSRQPDIENFALPFTHQSRLSFLACAACQRVWRLFPKFGVMKSQFLLNSKSLTTSGTVLFVKFMQILKITKTNYLESQMLHQLLSLHCGR
jgi:hypothetical protein